MGLGDILQGIRVVFLLLLLFFYIPVFEAHRTKRLGGRVGVVVVVVIVRSIRRVRRQPPCFKVGF